MLFSYEWLQEFLPNAPKPKELLEKLTMHSVEVEEVIEGGGDIGNVVVGELLEMRQHSNADTLNIGTFDVGEDAPRQIIFGGVAELAVGDKLPIALSPTVITGGFKIKERKLRGELSQGMCCLNSELGILDRKEQVYFFDADVVNGTPVQDVIPASEILIDIDNKSMTHRSDLFCHQGMAREIAAVFETNFVPTPLQALPHIPETGSRITVDIQDTESCLRYIAIEMEVQVGATSEYIQRRLQATGVKTINNVVDITNYVMMELGEPMHAFDADRIEGNTVIVRRAANNESILTLDNYSKKLNDSVLVIADAKKPIAVAGVIGGKDSGVTEQTTRIIVEVANFEPLIIRKSAQAVGVRTEGAMRWEKGLPAELATTAAERAVHLLIEHAGGKVLGVTDLYPQPQEPEPIHLAAKELERLAGVQLESHLVVEMLERLECSVEVSGAEDATAYSITPPWFRVDLHIPEDCIEEVVRLYGVNTIPEQNLQGILEVPTIEPALALSLRIKNVLAKNGYTEVYNYSFYGDDLRQTCGLPEEEHLELLNPLSDDLRYLRISLLPRLLETVKRNKNQREQLSLFEVGHLFFTDREVQQLAIVHMSVDQSFQKVRGAVEAVLHALHMPFTIQVITEAGEGCPAWKAYEGAQALQYSVGADVIGTIGQVSSATLEHHGIEQPVAFASLSISALLPHVHAEHTIVIPSLYPAIPIDLSFIVDEHTQWKQIEDVVRAHAGDLFQSIEVFDVYQGTGIPQGRKSVAFHLVLQSDERTLEMKAIEAWRDELVALLHTTIGAILRDT